MIAVIVNTVAVVVGGFVGLLFSRAINEKTKESVFSVLGLSTLLIGIKGALNYENIMVVIISLVLGTIVGEWIDIQAKLENLSKFLERKFSKDQNGKFAKGFITATLLYCVGAMAIMGSLQSGLEANHEILYAKSILDFFAAIIFASTLGIGVVFGGVSVFLYQGAIVLAAVWIRTLLSDFAVLDMNSIGSLLIIAIGLDLLEIRKLKIANMLPALLFPIVYYMIF